MPLSHPFDPYNIVALDEARVTLRTPGSSPSGARASSSATESTEQASRLPQTSAHGERAGYQLGRRHGSLVVALANRLVVWAFSRPDRREW